jgi:hypothetical protein
VRHFNLDAIGGGADDDSGEYPPSWLLGPGFHHRLALSNSVIKRLARLRAKVRRRKIATQPFKVMRGRMRGVFARNPRSHSRSTTAEGGRRFLKNAKCPKKPRSPGCKSRSTQERGNFRTDTVKPPPRRLLSVGYPQSY